MNFTQLNGSTKKALGMKVESKFCFLFIENNNSYRH